MAVKEPCSRIICLVGKDKMTVGTKHSCVASRRIICIIYMIVEIEFAITLGEDREIMPMEVNRVRSLPYVSVMW